jgi:hypothetical protein
VLFQICTNSRSKSKTDKGIELISVYRQKYDPENGLLKTGSGKTLLEKVNLISPFYKITDIDTAHFNINPNDGSLLHMIQSPPKPPLQQEYKTVNIYQVILV